ncbi:hypothetical protein [Roseibium sp.]|uniref:hypothetical protein n=1 Tax=Roseibium sp. TaxID=1936156 RepID=UPI003A9691F1
MKNYFKISLLVALIAALGSFISNSEKILYALQKYGSIALNRTAALGGGIETYVDYVALGKIEEIYDGQACAISAQAVSMDNDSIKNDLLVRMSRRVGISCSEVSPIVSFSLFRFNGFGYDFIDDLSGYAWPGISVDNLGPFFIVQVNQTDFPQGMVMRVNGDRLERVLPFLGWTEAGGGDDGSDEFANVQYTLVGDCLLLIAAGESKRIEICSDDDRTYDANPISFDRGPILGAGEACEEACSLYVEMLSRWTVPGHCVPHRNVLEWENFPYTYRIERPEKSVLEEFGEARGEFFCFPNSTLTVIADKADFL